MHEVSYLGVEQIKGDSVVHHIIVVRCVPVAAKTKRSLMNPSASQTRPVLRIAEMLVLTFPTHEKKDNLNMCESNKQTEMRVV